MGLVQRLASEQNLARSMSEWGSFVTDLKAMDYESQGSMAYKVVRIEDLVETIESSDTSHKRDSSFKGELFRGSVSSRGSLILPAISAMLPYL